MRRACATRDAAAVLALALAIAWAGGSRADAAPARRAPEGSAAPRAPLPAPEARWRKARDLADRGRIEEALAETRRGLEDHPDDTGLLWLEAGLQGEAGRHAEAVTLYETLMTHHPGMARDLRRDLAAQRLWAGDAAGALRDLDLALEETPPEDRGTRHLRAVALARLGRHAEALAGLERLLAEDPGDARAALDRARVLSWMGRHAQAGAAFEAYARRHPEEPEARLALAQNVNWSGDHRRAAALYQALRRDGSTDPEVGKGLAYAEYWAGRHDRAEAALRDYLAERPSDPEGLSLARLLDRERARVLTFSFQRSDDTDALRVETATVELEQPLGHRAALMLSWRRDRAEDAGGRREPQWFTAGVDGRLSGVWSGRLRLGLVRPAPGSDPLGAGELALTARPDDRWRLDVGWSREPVLTRQSLALGLMAGTLTTGLDWRAGDRVTLHADQRLRFYGDDNRSALHAASARARLRSGRVGELGGSLGLSRLATRRDLDHGYYDPPWYVEAGAGADLTLRRGERALRLEGRLGRLRERGSPSQPFYGVTAGLDAPLTGLLVLHAEGGRTNSNLGSDSGYRQERWAAWLSAGF